MFNKLFVTVEDENFKIKSFSHSILSSKIGCLHSHPWAEIIVPLDCKGKIVFNGKNISMKKGEIYIIPAYISHTERVSERNTSSEYFAIQITTDFVAKNQDDYPFTLKKSEKTEEISEYLKIASNYLTEENYDKDYVILNLKCFYYGFMKLIKEMNIILDLTHIESYSETTREIGFYITNNCSENLSFKEVAHKYGISEATLIKKFKKEYGVTPGAFLMQKRMTKACNLLITADFSVSYISDACGFESPAYFTACFRKFYGETPTVYRQNFKNMMKK